MCSRARVWQLGLALTGVLALVVGLPLASSAQSGPALATVQISLWPEFDKPSTLVILDGELETSVDLPVSLSIPIPAAAGAPHAVAVRAANGDMLQAPYTPRQAGNDIMVEFQVDAPAFRVEYYDPGLTMAGERRDYTLNWTTAYPVASLAVRVQQPYAARQMSLEPALPSAGTAEYGLTYYQGDLGALAAGQALSLSFSYLKPDPTLSIEAVGGQTDAQAQSESAAQPAAAAWNWPLLAGSLVLGLALVGGGVYWLRYRQRPVLPARAGGRSRRRQAAASGPPAARTMPAASAARPGPTAARPAPEAGGPARFCTACGEALIEGDRFCRRCGSAVRLS